MKMVIMMKKDRCKVKKCKNLLWPGDMLFCSYHRIDWRNLMRRLGIDEISMDSKYSEDVSLGNNLWIPKKMQSYYDLFLVHDSNTIVKAIEKHMLEEEQAQLIRVMRQQGLM